MAISKEYAYYIEGNQIAIVEKDVSFDNDINKNCDSNSTYFGVPAKKIIN